MLGADLLTSAPPGVEIHPRDRAALDIRDSRAVAAELDFVRPDIVINATGYTAVDRAEAARAEAFAVNAIAVGSLGRACGERGVQVLHFSSDYVFDGATTGDYSEEDRVAPLNAYGESKLGGECALLESGARSLIIRTQWLFGANGVSFPRSMWDRARNRQPTRVVTDQRGRPTYTVDLARATWALVVRRMSGLFHVANSGEASWYDVALRVFEAAGAGELLSTCTSREFRRQATRPARSILSTAKLEKTLGAPLPSWTDSLSEFLGQLKSSESSLTASH
jgi:dTDP-4-dehydrorhamnose reductase